MVETRRPFVFQLTIGYRLLYFDVDERVSAVVGNALRLKRGVFKELGLLSQADDDERLTVMCAGELFDLARAFELERLAALIVREPPRGVELHRALDLMQVYQRQLAQPLSTRLG